MITERQKALVGILRVDEYITELDIYCQLESLYPIFNGDVAKFHDSMARMAITRDIREINNSDYEKIIISSSKGVKIATEEEYHKYVNNAKASILKRLKRYNNIVDKGAANGQMRLELVGGESAFVEAFPKGV